MSRRDRAGCDYDAFVPDLLEGWQFSMPADLAADVADAESAVRDLNATATTPVATDGLARFLLRAESVASSRIEGLDAGPRRLLDAEVLLAQGPEATDRVAVEILANVAAMQAAVELGARSTTITLNDLLAIHATLMRRSPTPEIGGIIRTTQNWVGGSGYNPCSAAYVPPPAEHVSALLADLITYMNGNDHPALVQAAVAHAQFETIHPFADGNGRTGRALLHVILRRRGLAPRFVPPISLVLATWASSYINGLVTYRHVGPATSDDRGIRASEWIRTFATATTRACADATSYTLRLAELERTWRSSLGPVRAKSAVDTLLGVLPGVPLLTIRSAMALTGRSEARIGEAVARLEQAGVLRQRNLGRQRYRVFESPDVIALFTGLERALASPTGDTAASPPIRIVPTRPAPTTG